MLFFDLSGFVAQILILILNEFKGTILPEIIRRPMFFFIISGGIEVNSFAEILINIRSEV